MAGTRWTRRFALIVAAVVLVAVVAPFVYLNFIKSDAPAPLSIGATDSSSAAPSSGSAAPSDGSGSWQVSDGSIVGYRVDEVLFGQSAEAVGRTEDVTGSLSVAGTSITEAEFTADMTTVTSDEDRRDEQFNDRIMETATFPTATFALTDPIELGSPPEEGATTTAAAAGDLTLHGVTRSVTFDVEVLLEGGVARIVGSIPVIFADYDIENPSFGPVKTEDNGLLEFALNLSQTTS